MHATLETRDPVVIPPASRPMVVTGRTFFALGLIGMAATHFVFGDFMTGRAPPWPESLPGGLAWAWLTGLVFAGCGITMLRSRGVRAAALITAALIVVWALARNVPGFLRDVPFGGSWTRTGKSWMFAGGALAVAAVAPRFGRFDDRHILNATGVFTNVARIGLGLFLLLTGVQHFRVTEFVASLIPSWFPGDPVFWTYVAGVMLLTFGTGLLIPRTARWAALLAGCMVFSWFWIVHLPLTFTSVSDGVAVFEALAVAGLGFLLAGSLPRTGGTPATRD